MWDRADGKYLILSTLCINGLSSLWLTIGPRCQGIKVQSLWSPIHAIRRPLKWECYSAFHIVLVWLLVPTNPCV
jgi:hypothetical protein